MSKQGLNMSGQGRWMKWVPGFKMLRDYRLAWLLHDLPAGLVLATVLIPVGIAYAVASGLPGIYGLYATITSLFVYAIFGPSRILILGPDSSLTAVILAVTLPLSAGDPMRAVALASMMAIFSGLICLTIGLARLGFITELISKPIRYGYMNGIAIVVMLSQLPALLGFSTVSDGPLEQVYGISHAILAGQSNWVSLALGASSLFFILFLKKFKRIPGVLITVVVATLIVGAFQLSTRAQVAVLGNLPQGLPSFTIPWITSHDLLAVLVGGFAVAMLSFADTSVLSRTYALRNGVRVDPNQEMIGLGAANLVTGFFQGFAVSSSTSRTPVAEAAGAKTQLTGVVGAVSVCLLLLFAPDLLQYLPNSVLAAVVIASAIGLIEISDLKRIYRIEQWEFWLSMICLVGVTVLGVIAGMCLAIGIAILEFLWESWRPHSAILGRVDGLKGYHDITRYPQARLIPGLILFRWDAPLFFANAELFQDRILDAVAASKTPVRWVVVAAEPVTNLDVTASDVVTELDKALMAAGIELCFAEMKDPVKDKLKRFGLFAQIGEEVFFPTVGAAVSQYIKTYAVPWEDWEDKLS